MLTAMNIWIWFRYRCQLPRTSNPEILAALSEQADRLWHTSNIYFTEPQVRLASEIIEKTFANRVFFCNSGAEANEAAIKVARKFAYDNFSSDKRTIITFNGLSTAEPLLPLRLRLNPNITKASDLFLVGFDIVSSTILSA